MRSCGCHDTALLLGVMTPNQPKTPQRTIRIDADLWERAKAKAVAEGTTITTVIREFLARWVEK